MARTKQRATQEIMSLSDFSLEKQRAIADAVARPTPPPKWKFFGPPGSFRPVAAIMSREWYEWHRARGRDPFREARPKIPQWMRDAVLARDGLVCGICGDAIASRGDLHLDHIDPYSRGGPTTVANLQPAHAMCNILKGARSGVD